jgi:PAS domain S-box-containing protein
LQTSERDRVIVDAVDLASSNNKSVIHVLHVDDDQSILEIAKLILMDMGNFEIDHASCVDEAFKKLATGQYDIVISDYEMPQKDGLQFLKELREQKNGIPFVLFTGKGREEVAIKALNLGADGYFTKLGSPETVYGELCHGIRMAVTRKATEAALIEAQTLTNSIINSTKDMIWSVSSDDFRLLTFNNTMSDYFFRTQKLKLKTGMSTREIMPTEQLTQKWLELNRRALKEGSFTIEYSTLKEPRVLELTFDLLKRGGEVFGIAVFGRDITERKKAEETIRKSEARYRELANFLPEIVFEADITGKITFFSQKTFEETGFTAEDLEKGLNILSFVVPEERERAKEAIKKALLGEQSEGHKYALYKKNGLSYPAIVKTAAIICDNKVTGLRGLVIDLTELENNKEALQKSEQRFRQLILSSPDTMHLLDPVSHKIEFLNRKEFLGYSCSELEAANSILPWLHPDDRELVQACYQLALKGSPDGQRPIEYRLKNKAGNWEWVRSRATILKYDNQGKPEQILVTLTVITESKKVEQSLKESEEKFKKLAEESPNIIFINKRGRVVYANKKCEETTGYSREEVYSPNFDFLSLNPPEYIDAVKSAYGKHLKGETVPPYEYALITKDGKRINALINTSLIEYNGDKAILGIVTDITERKKAEEEIKFQADLLNHVGQAIMMVDNNQIIRFWNNGAEKLYGWTKEQALGHNVAEFLGGAPTDGVDHVKQRLMAGESWSTEFSAKKRDGSFVPIILNRTPIFNEEGVFVGAASIATDITSQKSTEADLTFSLESLSNSLDKIAELNEKLRVVGSLTRHDVRNKLSTVTAYAYLLKKRHSDQVDIVDGLGKMEQAVKQTSRIFDFAKMYEQIGEEELTYVDAEEKLKEAAALFSGPIPTVMNECHGSKVLADSFLRQMFFNFIDNTIKYGKKTKTIRVHFERADQDSIKLVYEDDGVGVPSENKPRLFSEVFSTGGSTGFGLFLIKKMMDVYGWQIQENGKPGEGAKFIITIPKLNKNRKENYQIAK